jgi:hypothetical protein
MKNIALDCTSKRAPIATRKVVLLLLFCLIGLPLLAQFDTAGSMASSQISERCRVRTSLTR